MGMSKTEWSHDLRTKSRLITNKLHVLIRAEKRVQSYSAIINILQSTEKPINGHLCTIENRSGIISESYVSFSHKIDKF